MAGTMASALSVCAPFRLSLALLSSHSLVSSLYLIIALILFIQWGLLLVFAPC